MPRPYVTHRTIGFHRLIRLRSLPIAKHKSSKRQTEFKPSNWMLYAAILGLVLFTIGVLTTIALLHG